MIKFEFLVCAEKLIRDAESDSYSAINILEDYVVETVPAFLQKKAVLLVVSRESTDDGSIPIKFKILNNETDLYTKLIDVNFDNKLKVNVAFNIQNLPIQETGKLAFQFEYGSDTLKKYTVNIIQRSSPSID